jgi:hypothetical protein
VTVVLTNSSDTACVLTGYAGLGIRLPGPYGSTPNVVAVRGGLGAFVTPPPAESSFLLYPGDRASFLAGWYRAGVGSCHEAGALWVTPPNTTTQLLLPIPVSPVCAPLGETALQPGGSGS